MDSSTLDSAKELVKNTFQSKNKTAWLWLGFITASLFVYFYLSDGDFSFLLTFGAFLRCFGLALLNHKMYTSRSAKGVSLKSLELYALVFFFRLLSIMRHQGYLPFDKTGDWFYHAVEVLGLLFTGAAIFLIFGPFVTSYEEKYDVFGNLHIPSVFGALYLFVPCAVLAMVLHPGLNNEWFSDTCWTLSMYLESCAIFPQLYMFQKKASDEGGEVDWTISHFVFALGIARVAEMVFWLSSYKELTDYSGGQFVGVFVLLMQFAHVVLMGDFFYYYIRAIRKGGPMELPTHFKNVV